MRRSNPSRGPGIALGFSRPQVEGNTLVVDTINIFPEAQLFIGQRVTARTHVSERITRVGNRMRIDTVVVDPEL